MKVRYIHEALGRRSRINNGSIIYILYFCMHTHVLLLEGTRLEIAPFVSGIVRIHEGPRSRILHLIQSATPALPSIVPQPPHDVPGASDAVIHTYAIELAACNS